MRFKFRFASARATLAGARHLDQQILRNLGGFERPLPIRSYDGELDGLLPVAVENGRSTPFARNATRIGKVATTAGVRQRPPPGPPEADNPGRPACSEAGFPECDARPCR